MPCDQELLSQRELLDEVYRFCIARARERVFVHRSHPGMDARLMGETEIEVLREFRREIVDRPWAATDGLDFFCTYAMRDRHHPDYRPEWASA
jgi:hypothetical protein